MEKGAGFFISASIFALIFYLVGTLFFDTDATLIFNIAWSILGIGGLLTLITLPWNLYFEARALIIDQKEAKELGREVKPEKLEDAKKLAKRLLFLCLSLHIFTGSAIAIYTFMVPNPVGLPFAALFLISAVFRPLASYYQYQMEQLRQLRTELFFPREDVNVLRAELKTAVTQMDSTYHALQRLEQSVSKNTELHATRFHDLERNINHQKRDFDEKVDKVCHEFTRSIEKLTQDQDVLRGIKALVTMIKSS